VAVYLVVLDDTTGDLVTLVRREQPAAFPFGSQQFGPTPNGRLFPFTENANNALLALQFEAIADGINNSPLLSDVQRQELRQVYATILPGDQLQTVGKNFAVQSGLVVLPGVADVSPKQKSLIAVFIDP
jgi:hypothetical protein